MDRRAVAARQGDRFAARSARPWLASRAGMGTVTEMG